MVTGAPGVSPVNQAWWAAWPDGHLLAVHELEGKPGDVRCLPPQVAPYHLRPKAHRGLVWFAALSPAYAASWLPAFLVALLDGNPAVLRLPPGNPFPDAPPAFVRARRLCLYRFSSWCRSRSAGAWWVRTLVGDCVPPVTKAAKGCGRVFLDNPRCGLYPDS